VKFKFKKLVSGTATHIYNIYIIYKRKGKDKGKVQPRTGYERAKEE
jgi:hypothetical protein